MSKNVIVVLVHYKRDEKKISNSLAQNVLRSSATETDHENI